MPNQIDAYVQIETIAGEASAQGFDGQIQVSDYEHQVAQTPSSTRTSSGAQATGRADVGRIRFSKWLDAASPQLMLACCEGRHIGEVKFSFTRAGSAQNVYYTVTLHDVLITQVKQQAQGPTGDETLFESVELYFRKIEWEHFQTDQHGGGVTGSQMTGWDASVNVAA